MDIMEHYKAMSEVDLPKMEKLNTMSQVPETSKWKKLKNFL